MPEYYTAIVMENEEVKWSPKVNPNPSDSGPDDLRLIIEFEGDLATMSWVSERTEGSAVIDLDALVECAPRLFDKAWLRGRGPQKASVAAMGHHYIIDIQL